LKPDWHECGKFLGCEFESPIHLNEVDIALLISLG